MAQMQNVNSIFARSVRAAAEKGALSHAVILSGEGDKAAEARFLAAAYLCDQPGAPCLACAHCRKVMENIHPDLLTVEELEKKELAVDTIREVRAGVYIRPNEAARKVYLFPNCDQLNEKDQNVLLKIVEEGPAYSAFLFCTRSAGSLLPTIRSRCTELKLRPAEELPDMDRAVPFLSCVGKKMAAAKYFAGLESKKLKREQLQDLLQTVWEVASQVLLSRRGKPLPNAYQPAVDALSHVSDGTLIRLIDLLRRYGGESQYNVGPAHVLGALMIELTDLEEPQ